MGKARVGLALGGGAARGWAHIGIIETLERAGVRPQVVAGTSIGAFVGAAWATGRLEELREWAEAFTWPTMLKLLDISLSGGGLIAGVLVEQLLERIGVSGDIEDLDIRFAAVATDYVTGHEEWLDSGPLVQAVRASISLPGIFAPVRHGDNWLVDGGLVNPVPVSTCRALGADFIIAVNVNADVITRHTRAYDETARGGENPQPDEASFVDRLIDALPPGWAGAATRALEAYRAEGTRPPDYLDVLTHSINIMQDRITRARLAGEPPHVMIAPRLAETGLFSFDEAGATIAEGRRVTEDALPQIERALSGAGRP